METEAPTIGVAEPVVEEINKVDFPPMLVHLYVKRNGAASRTTHCGIHGATPHGLYHRSKGEKHSYSLKDLLPPACPTCGASFCPVCRAVHEFRARERGYR